MAAIVRNMEEIRMCCVCGCFDDVDSMGVRKKSDGEIEFVCENCWNDSMYEDK